MSARSICIVTETYHPEVGGGETQARLLAEGLVARGWTVRLIARRSRRELPKRESIGGIELRRLPPSGAGRLKKWWMAPPCLFELLRTREHYDVVFVSGFRVLGLPALLAARTLGKACVLKPDSLGEMSGDWFAPGLAAAGLRPDSRVFRSLLGVRNRLLRGASAFVAISSPIEHELLDNGVAAPAVRRIPNGVAVDRFAPVDDATRLALRAGLGLPRSATLATYTGRLVSYKGLAGLLRVWRRVRDRFPDARLQLVGSGSLDIHNVEAELKRYVEAESLGESVIFTGPVDDVPSRLQASDLFVFPAEREAFGISLIEAMACGLPVVTTRSGGLADIVSDGRDGCCVPADDDDALFAAIGSLLDDPARRERLGRAARDTVVRRFAAASVIDAYAALFRALSDAPGNAG